MERRSAYARPARAHRVHRIGKSWKTRGAFPMTIRPQRPPTESRPRSATPNKNPPPPPVNLPQPGFPTPAHPPSLRNHLVERPNKSDRRDWRALSIKNDETERRGAARRGAARGSPRPGRADGAAPAARAKLIPQPPCPLRRNKLKRLGIPRGRPETGALPRLARDRGKGRRGVMKINDGTRCARGPVRGIKERKKLMEKAFPRETRNGKRRRREKMAASASAAHGGF